MIDEDPVNHPAHYKTAKGLEAITVIEAFFATNYHLGTVFKYLARHGKKDETKTIEDLKKAQWYLNRYIEYLDGSQK